MDTINRPWQSAAAIMSTAFALLACQTGFAQDAKGSDARPNIILIMADDMGYSDLGCYGSEIDTPNLDRLAAGGLQFTQFYNCAKCTTTRAAIVTGRYPRPKGGLLKPQYLTIGELMKSAGYQTGLFGKWHLGHGEKTHPFHRGFDNFYGLLDGCCNFFDPSIPDPKFKGGRTRVFGEDDKRITEFPDGYYTTNAFTDATIGHIRQFSAKPQPFFIHLTYTAPHYPLHAPPELIAKYRGKYKNGWIALRDARLKRQQKLALLDSTWSLPEADSRSYDWAAANQDWEDLRMATYAAMVDSMDQNIGRIIKTLEELESLDNTLILFLSDNGGCAEEPGGRDPKRIPGPKDDYTAVGPAWGWVQNTPFRRYKQWVNEGGISTPLIAHWPSTIKPARSDQPGHIIDFAATFAEIAGIKWPEAYQGTKVEPVEGKSLMPIFSGLTRGEHSQLCWEWSGNRAIRRGNWKLVYDKLVKHWALYDIPADRTETTDLASKHPQIAKELEAAWLKWANETGISKKKR